MEPASLDTMLEAVEKYMGEQFTEMLDDAITRATDKAYSFGRIGYRYP